MKNTKKKGNPAKKLIPAAGSLMVSAVMLATSTYAWFTMSRTVEVRGMQLKTKVSGNLLISETNEDDSKYGTDLVQGRKALLEPTSTTTGANGSFWYTVDAKADGSKLHAASGDYVFKNYSEAAGAGDTPANAAKDATMSYKTYYDADFNDEYEITPAVGAFNTAYGYEDYVFYLKASADDTNDTINMTKCVLSREGAAITDEDLAWRVAVFATATAAETQTGDPASAAANLKGSILALDGAAYHDSGKAVTAANGGLTTVTFNDDTNPVVIGTVGSGETAYYKVTVRIWLEGQDTTCTSETYAALDDDTWRLDLEFKLESDDTNAIHEITTAAKATHTNNVPDGTNTDFD